MAGSFHMHAECSECQLVLLLHEIYVPIVPKFTKK